MAIARAIRVGSTPYEVVLTRGTHRLLRYRRSTPAKHAQPVLFCYALVNRPFILDLRPGKSVVEKCLECGFDVYLIDWGEPTVSDRTLTLEHYVAGFLAESVRTISSQTRCPLHLIGYCMGGTMAAIYAATHPDAIHTLTLLAAPIDFGSRESLLNVWAAPENFDVDAFVDAYGNAPAWFLQACFLAMKPVQNLIQKNISFWENIEDPKFLETFFAMEMWVNDNIAVAGEAFREFVKAFYQENRLVRGEFRLCGQLVNLRNIRCPLLLLAAKEDHLVPPSSTTGILPYVSSRDVSSVVVEAGHVGLVVSSKAYQRVWPAATRWLADRSTAEVPVVHDEVRTVYDERSGGHHG
jgi:polyhydroxyalkanoate synthase subunit PhaC